MKKEARDVCCHKKNSIQTNVIKTKMTYMHNGESKDCKTKHLESESCFCK